MKQISKAQWQTLGELVKAYDERINGDGAYTLYVRYQDGKFTLMKEASYHDLALTVPMTYQKMVTLLQGRTSC